MRDERSAFQGMSVSEIRGMPLTGEALGQQLGFAFNPTTKNFCGFYKIALRQERYVREVWLRVPWWRPRKRKALNFALHRAFTIADLIHGSVVTRRVPQEHQGAKQ